MANTVKNSRVVPVRIIVMVAVLVLVVIVAGASFLLKRGGSDQSVPLMRMGNHGGNLAEGGAAVEAKGSVYLSDAHSQEIISVTPGKTSGTSLGVCGRYLNTDGTNLWYVDAATGYLMKTDLKGASPEVVVAKRVSKLMLAEDYLYYVDVDSNYALSRIALAAGSAPELLSSARVQQYAVVGSKIFYRDLNGADCACYMNLDGSDARALTSMRFGQKLFGQGNRVYFTNPDRDGAIDYLELRSDGYFYGPASNAADSAAFLDTGTITAALEDGARLYYVKASDGCLYRRDLDTAAEEKLCNDPVYGIQDAGGYIYVQSVTAGGEYTAIAK